MKFDDFLKKCNDEVNLLKHNFRGSPQVNDKNTRLRMVHQTIETNRMLVLATWALAIGTLILSGITLYLTFLQELLNLRNQ